MYAFNWRTLPIDHEHSGQILTGSSKLFVVLLVYSNTRKRKFPTVFAKLYVHRPHLAKPALRFPCWPTKNDQCKQLTNVDRVTSWQYWHAFSPHPLSLSFHQPLIIHFWEQMLFSERKFTQSRLCVMLRVYTNYATKSTHEKNHILRTCADKTRARARIYCLSILIAN